MIHQVDTKDKCLLHWWSFTAKYELVFVLTLENGFYHGFYFKVNRNSIGSSKKQYLGFSKQTSVWEISMFLCDNQWKFWTFSTVWLWKMKISGKWKRFSENWSIVLLLKVPTLKTHSFHIKPYMSEANAKIYRMMITKWTYHRKRNFASNYYIFLKILLQFKNLL